MPSAAEGGSISCTIRKPDGGTGRIVTVSPVDPTSPTVTDVRADGVAAHPAGNGVAEGPDGVTKQTSPIANGVENIVVISSTVPSPTTGPTARPPSAVSPREHSTM